MSKSTFIKFKFKSNTSNWQTRQLGALLRGVTKNLPHILTKGKAFITVKTGNLGIKVDGQAENISFFTINLPTDVIDKKLLCCYMAWCLAIVDDMKPRDLRGSAYYDCRVMETIQEEGFSTTTGRYAYEKAYAWADDMPLDHKPITIKSTGAALAFKKAEQAQDKVFEWCSKVKKATTILKKWERRLKYYEQRAEKLQIEWAKDLQAKQKP